MGAAAPIIGIVLSVGGAIMQYRSQQEANDARRDAAAKQEDAARQSRRLAELNAINKERETTQELANLKGQTNREEALSRARAAASGVNMGTGSFGLALEDQEQSNREQYAWLKQTGASQADILREQGKYSELQGMAGADVTRAGMDSGWGAIVGGAKSAYSIGAGAGYW